MSKEKNAAAADFAEGLHGGIPIALGYLSVSFAYGIMAQTGGLDLLSTVMISMTNLTSAGQLAGTQLIFDAASYMEIAVTTFVINLRYMLMSLSLSQRVDEKMTIWQRLLVSFGITDEIFAVSYQRRRPPNAIYMFGLILLPYIGWALGTFLGSAAGYVMPERVRSALGIAIYGMFVAIVVPVCKRDRACLFVAVFAGAVSCCLRYIPLFSSTPQGWAIIICALSASVIGALLFPIDDKEGEGEQ